MQELIHTSGSKNNLQEQDLANENSSYFWLLNKDSKKCFDLDHFVKQVNWNEEFA